MAAGFDSMKQGLSLVEQEMPASISFHVPDQYHKRIIGIGGSHIQRIMKKHSVFVKFSNAMDRGRTFAPTISYVLETLMLTKF
jgi:KH domain